jgi:beta-galactosidase
MRALLHTEYIPFGAQYYRAPSPSRGDWERDLAAMAAQGFNTVKYWIQWRWNNPEEGGYAFDDIDTLMDLAHRNGLRVMLNTIVDVAPAWIYRTYADASMVTLDGRRIGPQVQPHRQIGGLGVCFNHVPAMEHLFAFLRVAVRRYAPHPALAMWNVASEPELTSSMAEMRLYAEDATRMGDMLCYCARCQEAFRVWLLEKYGQIDALNLRWNRNYRSFDDVEVPITRNSFNDVIDWRMFFVHTLGRHVRRRFAVAREEDRGAHPLLCHHVFVQGFPVTSTASDPWNVGDLGDLHGITQMDDPMMCDVLRSCARGKPVISAEMLMLYGYTLELPAPVTTNDVKRFIFNGVAANLKGFLFWQYRPEVLAREAPAWGLTYLDGSPTPWLEAYADAGRVLQKNAGFLLDAVPRSAEVAIVYNPENHVFAWASTGNEKTATDALLGTHKALYAANVVIDFLHPREMTPGLLSRYRVILLPFPYFLDRATCAVLAAWVQGGGVLIGESYFAGWCVDAGRHQTTVPGYGLEKVFMARQGVVAPARPDGTVEVIVAVDLPHMRKGEKAVGALVQESLVPEGADVLARFPSGEAAVTVAAHGKGHAILIGTYLGMPFYRHGYPGNAALLTSLVDLRAIVQRPGVDGDGQVRVDVLTTPGGRQMLILRNLESRTVDASITLPGFAARELAEQFSGDTLALGGFPDGATLRVCLEPSEVRVYRD